MKGLILVTGSDGLVGSRFTEISKCKNLFHNPKQVEFDITDIKKVIKIFLSYDFRAVVNFAAFTDVGLAEEERGDKNGFCWQVNVEGVRTLANAVKPYADKIHFIQISTDMVFSGNSEDPGPYSEQHPIEDDLSKLTWYGYTKSQGERAVRKVLGERASIVRIIYPVRAKFDQKYDYIRKALSLYDSGKLYPMFSDQKITITFIDELCGLLDKIILEDKRGIFHACSQDTTTPYGLISEVLEKTRGRINVVEPIVWNDFIKRNSIPEYRYPHYGGLSVKTTEENLNISFRNWKEIVSELITQGMGKGR